MVHLEEIYVVRRVARQHVVLLAQLQRDTEREGSENEVKDGENEALN